jgi:hypothetical protein
MDLARWANNRFFYKATEFGEFEPRKGFKCKEYLKNVTLKELSRPNRPEDTSTDLPGVCGAK